MKLYASFFLLFRESARSIGHRSDTLTTLINQTEHSDYNAFLERFYYILNILDSS